MATWTRQSTYCIIDQHTSSTQLGGDLQRWLSRNDWSVSHGWLGISKTGDGLVTINSEVDVLYICVRECIWLTRRRRMAFFRKFWSCGHVVWVFWHWGCSLGVETQRMILPYFPCLHCTPRHWVCMSHRVEDVPLIDHLYPGFSISGGGMTRSVGRFCWGPSFPNICKFVGDEMDHAFL